MVAEYDRDRNAERLEDRHEFRNGCLRFVRRDIGTVNVVAGQYDQIGLRGADGLPQEQLDAVVERFIVLNIRKVQDAELAVLVKMQVRVLRRRAGKRGKDCRKRERTCQQDAECLLQNTFFHPNDSLCDTDQLYGKPSSAAAKEGFVRCIRSAAARSRCRNRPAATARPPWW